MDKSKIIKSEEEWGQELTPDQYHVLRQKGTERPGSGKYNKNEATGIYTCAGCGNPVFKSVTKYDSGSGWPSFTAPYSPDAVEVREDRSHGMIREEILCGKCGGHLGHKFPDGPKAKGGQRYCINSIAMDFIEEKDNSNQT